MPSSAEHTLTLPAAGAAQRGFTLLEIMCVVGLLGVVILPILGVREQSSQRAYRSSHMIVALNYAEQILADAMVMTDERDELVGQIEDDPQYTYTLTLKEFDLSTGMHQDEDLDDEFYQDDSDAALAYQPGDSGTTPEEEDEERDNPHRVRRFSIEVRWPKWSVPDGEDEQSDAAFDSVLLEGFLPRYWEDEEEEDDGTSGVFGR